MLYYKSKYSGYFVKEMFAMNAINTYFIDVIKKHYVDFSGRATRTQYWMFVLFDFIGAFVLALLGDMDNIIGTLCSILYALYALALLLPSLSIAVRRLHDTDKSGWWLLISLLPFVGGIVLLVFMVLPSTPAANRFGDAK